MTHDPTRQADVARRLSNLAKARRCGGSKRTLGTRRLVKKNGGTFLVRTDKITPLRAAESVIKRHVIIGFDRTAHQRTRFS
jgi:hypothetical protein